MILKQAIFGHGKNTHYSLRMRLKKDDRHKARKGCGHMIR